MPDTSIDSRQAKRTRNYIVNIMFNMLKSKDFINITVNDICHVGEISRTTFYKYFVDKYDLVNFSMELFLHVIEDDYKTGTSGNAFQVLVKHYAINKAVFKRLLIGGGDQEVLRNLNYYLYKYVKLDLINYVGAMYDEYETDCLTLSAGICQLLNSWLIDKLEYDEKELAHQIKRLFDIYINSVKR